MKTMPDYAGNNLTSAREISFGTGSQTFSDRVDTFDTDDYYRISLSGRSSLNLAVNGLSANANLQLLDRNGNTLRSSTNSAGIAESIDQVLDANVYYIRVYQDSSSASTDYTLNLTLQNSPKTDILWRDYSTGTNAVWFMGGSNNATITASNYLTSVATNWRVEGIADFNGDNHPDLLWRDYSSGANAVWFMGGTNNTSLVSSTYLTSVSTNWQIEGIADFNGDNRPDLLWRDYSSGANAVWFMGGTNNTTIAASTLLTSVSTNWQIEGIADFNGDNRPDLLWRDYSSGANAVWFMGGTNNTTIAASTLLTSVSTNWQIEGIADFNGDNRPDLLWRDYSSGANAVWFMGGTNNTTIAASTLLTSVSTNWQAIPYTRYEEPQSIDLAGNTTNTAFNVGTLSGSGVFSDRIDSTDPNDYYQFTLASASTVNLSLNGLSANADIQLLNSNGTVIQGSYSSSSSAESIGTTLSAGTYYVRVYQSSGSTNYSLSLSATATNANLYYFTYSYGNGDSYQGYGYTTDSSYYSGKYIYDTATNETGNKGYYYISNLYSGYSLSYNNQVYVSSYYNSENSTTYTPYSGSGSSGLGSEYGYLTSAQTSTNDYFGGKYYEADAPSLNLYYFTYAYGNGDSYQGYIYTSDSSYYSGKYIYDTVANETGNKGYYLIGSTYTGYDSSNNNKVYVYSYYNSENSTTYTPYSGSGSSGLGSEYGYVTNGDSNTYYGSKYYEADFGYQYYTFKYSYGSGQDYYTGYGYADYGKYTSSQSLNDTSANETGNYGFYQITGITNYASGTTSLNKVYVSSYYNSENSTSYTPYSGSGSNGLGSEYGYLKNGGDFSDNYFGGRHYEADVPTNFYYFTYSYGNGDYYQGYGYTIDTSYYSGKYILDTSANETGNKGYYLIGSVYTGSGNSYNNKVYVSSYYNSENSTTYTPYSGYGSNGLGSEYGYLTSAQTSSNDYFGSRYYEADIAGYQYYTFKYSYGSGQDYYTGYGYADYGKYTSTQALNDTSANETGNYGFYQITGITNYTTSTTLLNKVYVSSYYNSENSTSYTPYSGSGSSGLGSEYGYLTSAQTSGNDYFGIRYYEADVPTTIDLKGSSFSLSSTSLTAGNTVTAYFGVQNSGTGNAGSFNIKFYLSTDSTINTSDKYLSSYTISSLNSGLSTSTLSTGFTLPGATDSFWSGSKSYYIGIIVDADSSISESNEVNNSNTGSGLDYKDTYVTIPATSSVSISNLVFSGKEGDTGTFNVSLNQAISSNVTLTFNAGKFLTIDADGIISDGTQNTITFTSTDWNQSRTVWFIAENDDSSANRSSGNTLGYTLSGGLSSSESYDLGTIINTYAPDYSHFNIDLDFRNDTQNFWTSARRTVAQRAANDWANVIANELNGVTLSDQSLGMVGVNSVDAFKFTTNRYIDDLVIFVGSYNGGDKAAGWGGSYQSLGGWTTSDPLPRAGEFTVNAQEATTYSDAALYSVFCHEIGHALGLLGQDKTSYDLIDASTPQTAVFKGEYSKIANGGSYIPLQSQDGSNSVTGTYDYSHPANRVYSMMSYGYTYQLSAPTSIDFALLADSGYRVKGVNA